MIAIIMWSFTTLYYLLAMKNERILNHTKRDCNYHVVFVSKRLENGMYCDSWLSFVSCPLYFSILNTVKLAAFFSEQQATDN